MIEPRPEGEEDFISCNNFFTETRGWYATPSSVRAADRDRRATLCGEELPRDRLSIGVLNGGEMLSSGGVNLILHFLKVRED